MMIMIMVMSVPPATMLPERVGGSRKVVAAVGFASSYIRRRREGADHW